MQQFIYNIWNFVFDIVKTLGNILPVSQSPLYNNEYVYSSYYAFMNKNIFMENSLIGINITYSELFTFLTTLILIILFIVLFVKFIIKLITIFKV